MRELALAAGQVGVFDDAPHLALDQAGSNQRQETKKRSDHENQRVEERGAARIAGLDNRTTRASRHGKHAAKNADRDRQGLQLLHPPTPPDGSAPQQGKDA